MVPDQAIGRSRGRWMTKVYTLTDVIGHPYALILTAGNVTDVKAVPAFLERASRMRYLLAAKAYNADRLCCSLREARAVPVIPGRRNCKRTIRYDKGRCRSRHLIERAFCRLKNLRRAPPAMTTRCRLPVRRYHRNGDRILALIESHP